MPKKEPPVETRFKPGQSGNPSGKKKLDESFRHLRSLTKDEVAKIINKYAQMDGTELMAFVKARKGPALELAIASSLHKSICTGEFNAIEWVLNRSIGKIKDPQTEVNLSFHSLPTHELIRLGKEAIEVLSNENQPSLLTEGEI